MKKTPAEDPEGKGKRSLTRLGGHGMSRGREVPKEKVCSTHGEPSGPFRSGMRGTVCRMHEGRSCPQTLSLWGMLCELDIPSPTTKSLAAGMANKNHSLMVHSADVSSAQTVATLT